MICKVSDCDKPESVVHGNEYCSRHQYIDREEKVIDTITPEDIEIITDATECDKQKPTEKEEELYADPLTELEIKYPNFAFLKIENGLDANNKVLYVIPFGMSDSNTHRRPIESMMSHRFFMGFYYPELEQIVPERSVYLEAHNGAFAQRVYQVTPLNVNNISVFLPSHVVLSARVY